MQILIVNFNLDGLSEAELESSCDELAPAFAAVPGLASKVWLADRAEGTFGGVYTFEPPRKLAHTGAATPGVAIRRRSDITTTSATTSTGSCSATR